MDDRLAAILVRLLSQSPLKEIASDYFISRKNGDSQSGKTLKINGLAKFFNLVTFKDADFVFYEDNISYLKAVCDRFNIRGVYIPSVQGH